MNDRVWNKFNIEDTLHILSKDEKNRLKRNCLGTLAIENKIPSSYCLDINDLFLTGKISSKEAIKRIKEKYKRKE